MNLIELYSQIGNSDVIANLAKETSQLANQWTAALQEAVSPFMVEAAKTAAQVRDNIQRRVAFKKAILDSWNALEEELKYKNRYFPQTKFLSIFDKFTKEADFKLRKGKVLYRARKIKMADLL